MKIKLIKYLALLSVLLLAGFKNAGGQFVIKNELTYQDGKSLYVFSKDGKFGIGRDSGDVALTFDSIIVMHHISDYNFVKVKDKWGTIDDYNQVIIPPEFDSLLMPMSNTEYIVAGKNGKFGLISLEGEKVVPFIYDSISATVGYRSKRDEEVEVFIAGLKGKYGLINQENKILLPIAYDSITNWIEYGPNGHYIKNGEKFGFVNLRGKVMFPCQYDKIVYDMHIEKFRVSKNGKIGLVDNENNVFLPFYYKKLYIDTDFWAEQNDTLKGQIVVEDTNGIWNYLDLKDGNPIAENVNKDSVFARYKSELFSVELIQAYKEKYKEGFTLALDTFSKSMVDHILLSKANSFIEFPDLHKEYISYIPYPGSSASIEIFKIREYLLSQGFISRFSGFSVDGRKGEYVTSIVAETENCHCEVALKLYPTDQKSEFKIIESLKCAPKVDRGFQIRRFGDLDR